MKPVRFIFVYALASVSIIAKANVPNSTSHPLGYSPTSVMERQKMSFDNYIDDLGYYDVKITVPASFSIADPRAVNDIYYNINPDWKETCFVSRMNNRPAAILEANNEEAAFIYPIVTQKAGRSYLMPKLQTACNIELDLRISQNNMQLDVNPMVDIISKDDMSVYSGADTVAVYELEFKKKLFDRYSRCIGIYLRKAAHPAMLLRIALTDESYPQKDDYIRLLLDNITYGDNPSTELAAAEKSIFMQGSEFGFRTKHREFTGLLPDVNDETLDELNRRKAWLEAHGMTEMPNFSDDVLEALNESREFRRQAQAKADSLNNEKYVDPADKIYPLPVLDKHPQFLGDYYGSIKKWIEDNMKYPADAAEKGLQGKVIVDYTVRYDGSVADVSVREAVPDITSFRNEAVRLISSMPKWTPGTYGGHNVSVRMTMPVNFTLPDTVCAEIAANIDNYDLPVDDNVYSFPMVDVRPKSPLGEINDREIWTKLSKNIRYTDKIINALGENKTGRVFLRCVINKDGTMGDPVIEMSTAKELNEEAIRVVKSMPKWIPGFKKGVPVKTLFDVLITFKAPH